MTGTVGSILAKLRVRQLALVAAIADEGSLSAAADRVHMSQPAATKALREIEAVFGGALFHRGSQGMSATTIGEPVIFYAHEVVSELVRLRDEVSAIQGGKQGRLKIGCTVAAIPLILTPSMASLLASRPKSAIAVKVDTSEVLLPQIADGQIELLIGRPYRAEAHAIEFERLSSVDLVVVCGPRHPAARSRRLEVESLTGWSWILPPAGNILRDAADAAFRDLDLELPRVAIETSSIELTLSMLAGTAMISVMPRPLAQVYERKSLLARLRLDLKLDLGPVGLIRRKGRLLSPLASALSD